MQQCGFSKANTYQTSSKVSVLFTRSDGVMEYLIVSTIDSGHHGVLYGGQEGPEEAVLVR